MTRAAVVVERVLPAPCEVVYDEWLSVESMSEWMCPRPARLRHAELDAVVGGRMLLEIDDDGRPMTVVGTYLTLDRPREIRFTWSCSTWPDPTVQSVLAVELRPEGPSGTHMTIRHEMLPPGTVENHERGWVAIADQLARALAGASRAG